MTFRREIAQSRCETAMRSREGPEAYLNSTSRARAASLPAEGSSQQGIRDSSKSAHE